MKKRTCLLLAVIFFLSLNGRADHPSDQLSIVSSVAQKNGNQLQMEFVFDYSNLSVAANDQLMVQPVILGTKDTLLLPYLLFPGRIRNKANLRKIRLYGKDSVLFPLPYATLYPSVKSANRYTYRQNIPFEKWMYGARIELRQDIYGCADCHKILTSIPLNSISNPPLVAFIIPVADTNRNEQLTLRIGFPWNRAVILPEFGDNNNELEKINHSIQRILDQYTGDIRQIELTGYASPEGKYSYNTDLAGKRLQAIKNYIKGKYPVDEVLFILDTVPEDWEGVRKWVQHSDLSHSKEVNDVISRVSDPDKRDRLIRLIDNNVSYNRILHEAYPPLRRVEYKVNYRVTPLSLEQLQEIYTSRPERLTPYELYSLAESFSPETPEFREIILTTVRFYPHNAAAQNNAACVALQQEDLAAAREFLMKSKESPQKLNNQGVLLLLEGKRAEAYEYFLKADRSGCPEAVTNRHNLETAHLQYENYKP